MMLSTGTLQGMEARIVREDGTDADADEPGEIYLRGGNVVLGYWNNETATRDAFLPGGWLRTGDRFRTDAEGRFLYAADCLFLYPICVLMSRPATSIA